MILDTSLRRAVVSSAFAVLLLHAGAALASGPVILTPPETTSACEGGTATFSVVASGTGTLAYQWTSSIEFAPFEPIPGATSDTLVIDPVPLLGNVPRTPPHHYRVAVDVTDDCGSVTSDPVEIAFERLPYFDPTPPLFDRCEGEEFAIVKNAHFNVPGSYQWRKDGEPIPGATSSTLVLGALSLDDTGVYDVVASNDCGTAVCEPIPLTVHRFAITEHPASAVLCAGGRFEASVTVDSDTPVSYQWFKDAVPIVGATEQVLVIDPIVEADSGSFHAFVISAHCSATSDPADLAVGDHPIVFESQPVGGDVCEGDPVTLSVVATSDLPLTYRWARSGIVVQGATGPTIEIAHASTSDSGD